MSMDDDAQIFSVIGGARRSGRWRVPGSTKTVTLFGRCVIDLRLAETTAEELSFNCISAFAGVTFIVPEGAEVRPSGMAILGSARSLVPTSDTPCHLPPISIDAITVIGRFRIRTTDDEPESEKPRRRRKERGRTVGTRISRRERRRAEAVEAETVPTVDTGGGHVAAPADVSTVVATPVPVPAAPTEPTAPAPLAAATTPVAATAAVAGKPTTTPSDDARTPGIDLAPATRPPEPAASEPVDLAIATAPRPEPEPALEPVDLEIARIPRPDRDDGVVDAIGTGLGADPDPAPGSTGIGAIAATPEAAPTTEPPFAATPSVAPEEFIGVGEPGVPFEPVAAGHTPTPPATGPDPETSVEAVEPRTHFTEDPDAEPIPASGIVGPIGAAPGTWGGYVDAPIPDGTIDDVPAPFVGVGAEARSPLTDLDVPDTAEALATDEDARS